MSKENITDIKAEEEEKGSSFDQNTEGEIHVIQFRIGFKKYKVACKTSQRLLDALNANDAFRTYSDKHKNKEIIIRRTTGKVPGAAVKTDFPCCLLEDNEIVDISFISNEGMILISRNNVKTSPLDKYKTFYIRTRGKIKKKIMMNNELALNVDHVCVYALKGETLQTALQRDGRFGDEIFNNPCELMDIFKDASYDLSLPVDCLCENQFEMYVRWPKHSASDVPPSNANNETQETPANSPRAEFSEQPKIEEPQPKKNKKKKKKSSSLTKEPKTKIKWDLENLQSRFPSTIKEILIGQSKDLLKKLKSNLQMQKLFHTEFGKHIKTFCEVSTMKELMSLSDSVCVIVAGTSSRGTGFLLFDKFVLTNAHVVKDYLLDASSVNKMLNEDLKAAFNYENVTSEVECLPLKRELAAYCHKVDGKPPHLDYALLELNVDKSRGYPQLLSFYKQTLPPSNGGIFIVGHPNCESKKIDMCFITEIQNQPSAINKHITENPFCPYLTWDIWPDLCENLITYDTCFFHGSSGSPVFDENRFLIGVHTGGYCYKDPNNETKSVIEYCISMQSILKSILETGRPDVIELLQKYEGGKEKVPAPGANIHVKEWKELDDVDMEEYDSDESDWYTEILSFPLSKQ